MSTTTPTSDRPNRSRSKSEVHDRATTWLKPGQVDHLRDVCLTGAVPTYLQDRNEAIVALAYDAGLRVGELVALDTDHVDLEAKTVYLPSRIQKGSPPPATLGLDGDTVRLLRRYLRDRWKDTEALLPSRSSERISERAVRNLVGKLAIEGDIRPQVAGGGVGEPEEVTPHTLRHSVAYRIIQVDGGRLEDVQLRLRHANRSTTDQIYSHLVPR